MDVLILLAAIITRSISSNVAVNLTISFSFQTKVHRLQKLLHDQKEKPIDRGIFWTEFFIRNSGAPHLRLASRKLNRFQRSLLDVYLILIAVMIILVIALLKCVRWTFKRLILRSIFPPTRSAN